MSVLRIGSPTLWTYNSHNIVMVQNTGLAADQVIFVISYLRRAGYFPILFCPIYSLSLVSWSKPSFILS